MAEEFSESVTIQDRTNATTITLNANQGNIYLGGPKADGTAGQDGDLHVRDALGNRTILLNGNQGSLFLGGAKDDGSRGTNGDIAIFTNEGTRTIVASGQHGNLTLGGAKSDDSPGHDGDLIVKDRYGETAIHLDGDSGEIKLRNWSISVADYVFEPDYPLRPLEEVEDFISEHCHLPDVPSAQEIAQSGVEMASFTMSLLRKIEELTLYALRQQQEITALKACVDALSHQA